MLPQLDVATYSSQIFWLIICLGILYYSLSRIYIPRLEASMNMRKNNINFLIEEAAKMQDEADRLNQQYQDEMKNVYKTTQNIRNLTISLFDEKMRNELKALSIVHDKKLDKLYNDLKKYREEFEMKINSQSDYLVNLLIKKIED